MEQGTRNKGRTPSPLRGTPPTLGGELPKKLYLDDGTEVRLVPIELTGGKALYMSMEGQGYSYVRNKLRPVKDWALNNPKKKIPYRILQNFNNILVHIAVLSAWVCPRPEGYQCDHINGNPQDNRLENLEWVTRAENMRRRWALYASQGKSFRGKKLTELGKQALRIRAIRHGLMAMQLAINFD